MIKLWGNTGNYQMFFNKIVLNLIKNKPNLILNLESYKHQELYYTN